MMIDYRRVAADGVEPRLPHNVWMISSLPGGAVQMQTAEGMNSPGRRAQARPPIIA